MILESAPCHRPLVAGRVLHGVARAVTTGSGSAGESIDALP